MDPFRNSSIVSIPPRRTEVPAFRETVGTNTTARRVEALQSDGRSHIAFNNNPTNSAMREFETMFRATDAALLKELFGQGQNDPSRSHVENRIGSFLLELDRDSELRGSLEVALIHDDNLRDEASKAAAHEKMNSFMDMEKRAQLAYRIHRDRFPTAIWHCCKNLCFARVATDPRQYMLLDELILIHDHANRCHAATENLPSYVQARRRGIGTSTVAFAAPSREEREVMTGELRGTDREKALRKFAKFVLEVLPFLYGQQDSPTGTAHPKRKLCTQATCCLLGVSRNFLYNRKTMPNPESATEDDLTSVIDVAGLRLRQHRRNGDGRGYPALQDMRDYNCGCDIPCFCGVPEWTLVSEYNDFIKLAKELKPRHKENRFLLNRLFSPLSNSTTCVCNRALSALYTVSEALVADVRRVLDIMCADSSMRERPLLSDGSTRYSYDRNHPINRYSDAVRDKVENNLDMVLRADPAGSTGASVCRVYSPEINTQEKLRTVLHNALDDDVSVECELSASTLQRMVKDYLKRRNYSAVSFTQSDHNACPNCKTLHYAVLQYHHEAVIMKREKDELSVRPQPFSEPDQKRLDILSSAISSKQFQEDQCLNELNVHNSRDARIRGSVKRLSDYSRIVENRYRGMRAGQSRYEGFSESVVWKMFPDRVCMTHQDDMSKIDLPHFVVTASSDITRWRFDVNAHVSAVTNDAVVLSHEQGTGPKNASAIIEEILMNHVLSCRGESIMIIVSDNAAVGKNWQTTVALPQYIVDQGLAEIVLVVFLENNHGKWLADMLFGQFQSRRKREVLLGVDDMLSGFEHINRKTGKAHGFAVNPLSSIDFTAVFQSLGYETKPPADFGFIKRNIHFSCACVAGAKNRLHSELRELLGTALPDDAGMVRLSTEPPGPTAQSQLRYEERYTDVPAARIRSSNDGDNTSREWQHLDDAADVPLVVPQEIGYSPSGNGVVSTRTAEHVGFNGIEFRRLAACPEMKDTSKPLVRQAWPRGLLEMRSGATGSDEPIATSESVKCAPLNWIVRRPVRHFCLSDTDWKARYPPRNLLNAKFRKGPREKEPWLPTATYYEPPFPVIDGTAACSAMKELAAEHQDIGEPVHFLHALRAIYRAMGDRDGVSDIWLQRRATMPSRAALARYRDELRVYVERERGHPKARKTLRQVFKDDERVLSEVAQVLSQHSTGASARTLRTLRTLKTQTLLRLFEEAENTPGALDRFYHVLEKDQERYARELKEFKDKQTQFDEEHGLLPLQ